MPGSRLGTRTARGRSALTTVQVGAHLFTVVAARRLGVLELAGITQLHRPVRAPRRPHPSLDDAGPYGLVRHPIYLGWLFSSGPRPS